MVVDGGAVPLTSFTILEVRQISLEIENPFGYDADDLSLNHYWDTLRTEVGHVNSQLRTHDDLFVIGIEENDSDSKDDKPEQT